MNAPTIKIDEEKAKEIYKDYLEIVKTRKEKYLKQLKQIYYHLSKGHQVLDIYEVFKESGVNKDGEPKLAICRADYRDCFFSKLPLGSGFFAKYHSTYRTSNKGAVILPSNTFPEWKTIPEPNEFNKDREVIERQSLKTKVPICPAHLLPKGKLDNYYILWEVSEWNEVPVVKDPFLLKRVNSNAFIVLAEWDLTSVEQAVIRGL